MKVYKIIYDNPSASYFSGSAITGTVLIQLNNPKKIKALKLCCIGQGQVNWSENYGDRHKKHCHSTENYFVFNTFLIGEENSEEELILPIGEHCFKFSIQLPGGLPSSFQGTFGTVQYFIKATITRPWKFSQKISSYFTVNGFLDLNLFGYASRPYSINQSELFQEYGLRHCLLCLKSMVVLTLTLDKTGYVPGDTIQFHVQVTNKSSVRFEPILLTLYQIITYTDRSRANLVYEKREKKVVRELHGPSVGAKEIKIWESNTDRSNNFVILPIPPTNLGGGSLISLQYHFGVTLKTNSFFEQKLEVSAKLIIGTVPYRNFFELLMPSFTSTEPSAQSTGTQNHQEPHPSGSTDLPPPTYAEAMELYKRFGSTSNLPSPSAPDAETPEADEEVSFIGEVDEAGSGRPFIPNYATYRWNRNRDSYYEY